MAGQVVHREPPGWNRLVCRFKGHLWLEQRPHHLWNVNRYDCTRCGAYKWEGIIP